MDRPQDLNDDTDRAQRSGATPIDSESDDEGIGSASYAAADKGAGGGGGGSSGGSGSGDDEEADEPHAASPVGGGTIYTPASDPPTQDPVDASGMQSSPGGSLPPAPPSGGAGGTPPPGEPHFDEEDSGSSSGLSVRQEPGTPFRGQVTDEGDASASGGTDGKQYAAREGVTRQADDSVGLRDQAVTAQEDSQRTDATRLDDGSDRPPEGLEGPGRMDESLDLAEVAPDGSSLGRGGLTSPTGEDVGGSGLSDAIQGRAGALGGDALGRGIDFDPSTPGTNESGPGGSGGGDPDMDRMIMGRDGSLISAEPKLKNFDDPAPAPKKDEGGVLTDMWNATKDFLGVGGDKGTGTGGGDTGPRVKQKVDPKPPADDYMENPDAGGDSGVTVGGAPVNLERVRVMEGSQVQPSNNPDDPATGGESTDNFIPPQDLVTRPTDEGEVEATTLTSAATLGSSPVVNPTDPVLGDDGVIHGGSYAGGGRSGGGGGEVMPTSMAADNASAAGGGADALAGKGDVNGVSIDMGTGQVIGSRGGEINAPNDPAMGGETGAPGRMVGQEDEGGGEGDDDPGVQSFGAGGVSAMGGPSATAFGAAAPMVGGGMVSQGDEDDGDDPGVQSFGGDEISSRGGEINAPNDPAMALGSPDAGFGGADLGPGAPTGLEGGPQSPDDGVPEGPPSDHDG